MVHLQSIANCRIRSKKRIHPTPIPPFQNIKTWMVRSAQGDYIAMTKLLREDPRLAKVRLLAHLFIFASLFPFMSLFTFNSGARLHLGVHGAALGGQARQLGHGEAAGGQLRRRRQRPLPRRVHAAPPRLPVRASGTSNPHIIAIGSI